MWKGSGWFVKDYKNGDYTSDREIEDNNSDKKT